MKHSSWLTWNTVRSSHETQFVAYMKHSS